MREERKINFLSEFIEKPNENIFGFTLTYKNGVIENHFIRGSKNEIFNKINELKKFYEELRQNQKEKN